ncbi:MAG: carboxypeptidase-like regulatory domain-containing protein, partial [Deferribacteraceae bacterium]|nr:carboxypeptidase-like regulatory domain-containing protein [Deferribacteraceae bacterium]
MKFLLTLFLILPSFISFAASQSEEITSLFPVLDDLPGGRNHWVMSILPSADGENFSTYSATYAYFAQEPTVLFDIPRKNVYSVNIRIHACLGSDTAEKVFEKFSKVGTKEQKRFVGLGERGVLYVVPNSKNPLMGDFYLTVKLKYLILQVHADDGFVLMDIAEKMVKRLSDYLRLSKRDIANGLTLYITGAGIDGVTQMVGFYSPNVAKIAFSGRLIDQNGANISGAKIKVLETGNEVKTGKNGEFSFNLGKGKGKTYSLYRFLTVRKNLDQKGAAPLSSGYYKVDIAYKDKTGQDVWKLWIGENGKISGTSLNLSDSKRLNFTGSLKNGKLAVNRPCGNSFIGICRQ